MGSIDITLRGLIIMYCAAGVVLIWMNLIKLSMNRRVLVSIARMTVQLLLAGVVLTFVFKVNNVFLVVGYYLMMCIFAAQVAISNSRIKLKGVYPVVFFAALIGTGTALALMLFLVVQPEPWFHAQYLIPLAGMLTGNATNANALALERLSTDLHQNMDVVDNRLALGATPFEAAMPYIRRGLQAAVTPTLTNMTGVGLVTLPGMMTGQMLSGTLPIIAIKYQIVTMLAIFISLAINSTILLLYGHRLFFTSEYQLRG